MQLQDAKRAALAAEIEKGIRGFTGSDEYTRCTFLPRFYTTEGMTWVCETAGAWWFTDLVASHQTNARVRREDFQVWKLKRIYTEANPEGAVVTCDNGNGRIIARQVIPYTDFPCEEFTAWLEAGSLDGETPARILLLPSEH
jgi:hypothetical protein